MKTNQLAWMVALVMGGLVWAGQDPASDHEREGRLSQRKSETVSGDPYDVSADRGGRGDDVAERPSRRESGTDDDDNSWADAFREWWSEWTNSTREQSNSSSSSDRTAARAFLRRYDHDDDGYLSREELPTSMRLGFERLDQNRDEYLSQRELLRHVRQVSRRQSLPVEATYVWIIDANQGNLDLSDVQNAYQLLQRIDSDNDGTISQTELQARRQQTVTQWCEHCFRQLDENDDDRLSWREARNSAFASDFDDMDRNGDGALTQQEIETSVEEHFTTDSQEGNSSDESTDSEK